jgi:hypothetical protein
VKGVLAADAAGGAQKRTFEAPHLRHLRLKKFGCGIAALCFLWFLSFQCIFRGSGFTADTDMKNLTLTHRRKSFFAAKAVGLWRHERARIRF